MNQVRVSGWVQGAPEKRTTKDGRKILNFEIATDDPGPHAPYVPIGYILRSGEDLGLGAGAHILAVGPLRHHRSRGLFVAAKVIKALADRSTQGGNAEMPKAALTPAINQV